MWFLAGCSLLTSLDGLQGSRAGDAGVPDAPADAAPADATPADAAPDQDAGPVPTGAFAFAASWGTAWKAASVAARPAGGYVVGGAYQVSSGQVNIGSYFLPTPVGTDALVVELDAKGNVTSVLGFGGSGTEHVSAVAADGAGAIYVAGATTAPAMLNGTNLPAGSFVAKLDATNLAKPPAWVRAFTGASSTFCSSCLQVTGSDVVALTTFEANGSLSFGLTASSQGLTDMLVVKLDPATGAAKWAGQIGSTASDTAGGLAVDEKGAIYLTGSFEAALAPNQALGVTPPAPVGSASSVLVAKLEPGGTPAWAHAYGDTGGTYPTPACVATDGMGHVAVGVTFSGGIDFGLGLVGAASLDGLVFTIDEAKDATAWQQTLGDADGDSIVGCTFDPWGHVVVTGTYRISPKIGPAPLPPTSLDALYVAKFSPSGASEWGFGYPRRGLDGGITYGDGPTPSRVVTASDGTVVVSGSLVSINDFGGGQVYQKSSVKGFPDALVVGWGP